jgi:hypothetical protein
MECHVQTTRLRLLKAVAAPAPAVKFPITSRPYTAPSLRRDLESAAAGGPGSRLLTSAPQLSGAAAGVVWRLTY